MDAGSTGQLGDADNGIFDVARCHHHEVGEFVHDHQQVRVGADDAFGIDRRVDLAGSDRLVEVVDVLEAVVGEVVVAGVHFADHPLQGLGGLLGVGDDGRDQVRDTLVRREFDAFGVHHDHADLIRGGAHQDRGDHGVHEGRLTGTSGTGDEQVGHLGEVRHHVAALDVLADAHDHRVVGAAGVLAAEHIAEGHGFAVRVGDLDADGGLAGDRAEDTDVAGRDGIGDVLGQRRDAFHLGARGEFDFITGDRGAATEAGDLGIHVELVERFGQ
ncbi:hypothetical protein D9M72_369000 [compost metagenome]